MEEKSATQSKPRGALDKLGDWVEDNIKEIWDNLRTNHLWQRMLKNTIATSITVILAMIPAVVEVYGKAAYLAPITTVFGHPGRRFGMMAEALALALSGTLVGIGWSMCGLYLSSLVYANDAPAAYTIRALFLVVAVLLHGFLRSHTPRLFLFVLLLIIVSVVSLTSPATAVSKTSVTPLLYPILTAIAILLLVNSLIFPEFSSSFLGITTIETLGETIRALRDAGQYFISFEVKPEVNTERVEKRDSPVSVNSATATAAEKLDETKDSKAKSLTLHGLLGKFRSSKESKSKSSKEDNEEKHEAAVKIVKLKDLTGLKTRLRAKLASCKAAQQECNFELAWAVLPPGDMKPINDTHMKKLVANTIALIGACESKYALLGDEQERKTENEAELKDVAERAGFKDLDQSHPGTEADSSPDESGGEDGEASAGHEKGWPQKKSRNKSRTDLQLDLEDLELVKPRREIEFGDVDLLKYLISRISKPLTDIQHKIDRSVDVVTSCLAYCYDVPKLPSGARPPAGIQLEEIDIHVDILTEAITDFDKSSAKALEGAAAFHELNHLQVDIMPRMETFLISSFLLNLRQAALHTLSMLNHSRELVEKRQARHDSRRLYAPRINWRKWLSSGGEEDSLSLPNSARKDARAGTRIDDTEDNDPATSSESLVKKRDVESATARVDLCPPPTLRAKRERSKCRENHERKSWTQRLRISLADFIEYLLGSDDVLYALKLTIAVFLVTWPAFLHRWNTWYSLNRGLWAALQLVLITEVAIGTSIMTFALRSVGTTIGCLWGFAAYQARDGNRIVCVAMIIIGIIPSTYVQLGTPYVKAGMVSIVSICIVALATEDRTVPGTATANFLKRLIAFLIGGVVALIVEIVLFPVKARDRLVESLASSIGRINEMEACLAYGIESETNVDVHSLAVSQRFELAKGKAQGALTAAETFLPFCANEPRLKGSFKGLALVYAEILYVLHAVVDRMDNMMHLRQEYGSGVLEEFNARVFPYRRNVAGSITLILFAVHEALTTKLPLPQFLPSARLAHLRMVNRVREVVLEQGQPGENHERSEIELSMVKRVVRQKFLSWNAASAGQIEVIEYLEELIDLTKLLVGANEFRSGMLTRPSYKDYIERIDSVGRKEDENGKDEGHKERGGSVESIQRDDEQDELTDTVPTPDAKIERLALTRRRTTFTGKEGEAAGRKSKTTQAEAMEKQRQAEERELPRSLQRVRSRRVEEMSLQRAKSVKEAARKKEGKRVDKSS